MNKVFMALLLGTFILTGACYAQTPAPAAAAPATESTTSAAAPAEAPKAVVHHHPELRKALRKLRGAKADLERAAHDYGGHKAKAIEAINQAIAELEAALNATN